MKPKNKFQQKVVDLSKKLPKITQVQKRWAFHNCFEHMAKRTKSGIITCLDCGYSWKSTHTLMESVCTCPNCRQELKLCDTRKFHFDASVYFCIITIFGNMQVLRYFSLTVSRRVGKLAQYDCHEVVQRWIAPNGKNTTFALVRRMSVMYYDLWNCNSTLEIRNAHRSQDITPTRYYPRKQFIPELKRI